MAATQARLNQQADLEKRARELHQNAKNEANPPPPAPGMLSTMAGFAAGAEGVALGKDVYKQGTEAEHSAISMETAGMEPAEIKRAHEAAARLSGEHRLFTETEIENLIREGRSILGSTDAAIASLPDILDLMTIAEAKSPGHGKEGVSQLLKGMETDGATTSPEKFHQLANSLAKVSNAFGDTIRYEDWAQFFKYAGTAAQHMSPEFIERRLPHLIQELGGASTGTMFQTMERAMIGGRMDKQAIDKFLEYGLLDPSKVHQEGGHYKLDAGALLHGEDYMRDMSVAVEKYIKPAFEAKHLSEVEQLHELETMFSNRMSARGIGILEGQSEVVKKTDAIIGTAQGLEGAKTWTDKDPTMAFGQLTSQFQNLLKDGVQPLIPAVTGLFNAMAAGLSKINDIQRGTFLPTAETAGIVGGLGYVGYKALEGGVKQGVKGILPAAEQGAKNLIKGAEIAELPAMGTLMVADAGTNLLKAAYEAQKPGGGGLFAPATAGTLDDDKERLKELRLRKQQLQSEIDGIKSRTAPGMDGGIVLRQKQGEVADLDNAIQLLTTSIDKVNKPAQPPHPVTPTPNITNHVTVNVAPTNASPQAIGDAAANAVGNATLGAIKQSGGTLHDGYGPH